MNVPPRIARSLGWALLAPAVLAAAGCGARSELDGGEPCPSVVACLARSEDPCGAPAVVTHVCDRGGGAPCPSGTRPYARAPAGDGVCLPFQGDPSIRSLQGSLVPVPADDGRCLWIAENVETAGGQRLRNVAFEADLDAPFGTCPSSPTPLGATLASAVEMTGAPDPDILVEIAGAYRMNGGTRVLYRLFRVDPQATFAAIELGTGFGTWASGHIVVGGPGDLAFPSDVDLGDAAVVVPPFAYLLGCSKGEQFVRECVVGRADAQDTTELFVGDGQWSASLDASAAPTVVQSGPWISSLFESPGAPGELVHLFAPSFGSDLRVQTASVPQGPWSAATSIAPCSLVSTDTASFCAGPAVHAELADPTRLQEVVVSYGAETTAPGKVNGAGVPVTGPEDPAYWTRLSWVTRP